MFVFFLKDSKQKTGNLKTIGKGFVCYLIVDVFALRCSAGLQNVVVVTVVDDEDPTRLDHTGNVLEGQLLVALVP